MYVLLSISSVSNFSQQWGPEPYPSKFIRRRPQYTVLYAFRRSKKTMKRVSWSTLSNSQNSLNSKIYFPITVPAHKPLKISCRLTLSLSQVSMIASTNFHNDSNRPIPRVSVLPLGISTSIFHPIYVIISPLFHMN